MLGRNDEAIEFLTQADPESGWLRGFDEYWVLLTLAYHQLGDYERELEAVDRMLQLNPERSRIALGIEMGVLAAEGRIEELGTRIPGLLQSYHGGFYRRVVRLVYGASLPRISGRSLKLVGLCPRMV